MMRKISEMYKISGGTDYRYTCYECRNCQKEKKHYFCRLYQEHGGEGQWKPSFIACKFFNLPHLPETAQKKTIENTEEYKQITLSEFLK